MKSLNSGSLPVVELQRSDTLADQAHRAIREFIATGHLAPGQRVTERSLAALLGVSPTPVREALRTLQQEGLIERRGARDVAVVEHSPEALRELTLAEVALRATQAQAAAAKITDEVIDQLEAIVDELEAGYPSNSSQAQLKIAHRFDELIAATAANRTLDKLIATVSIFGKGTRELSLEAMHRNPGSGVHLQRLKDHRDIISAFRARDPDLVESVVRRHLTSVVGYLLER